MKKKYKYKERDEREKRKKRKGQTASPRVFAEVSLERLIPPTPLRKGGSPCERHREGFAFIFVFSPEQDSSSAEAELSPPLP